MRILWHPPPVRGQRADARPKRRRRAEPSARGYLALVGEWSKRYARIVAKAIKAADPGTDEPLTAAQAKSIRAKLGKIRAPKTPSASRIAGVGKPVALDALSAEHRGLVSDGMPKRALLERLADDDRADVARVAGIDLLMSGLGQPLIDGWALDGADLIQTMGPLKRSRIRALISKAVVAGRSWKSVAADIEAIAGNADSNAKLIARDQISRLNAQITSTMQKAAGVEEYIWRATDDSRTRESHEAVDGNRYRWDGPGAPDVGFYGESAHPGQAGSCRCTAQPVPPKGNKWAERPIATPRYAPAPRS